MLTGLDESLNLREMLHVIDTVEASEAKKSSWAWSPWCKMKKPMKQKTLTVTGNFISHISSLKSQFKLFCDWLLCSPGWFQTCYVARDDHELQILLHPSSKRWDYRHEPPFQFHPLIPWGLRSAGDRNLGTVSHVLGSANWIILQSQISSSKSTDWNEVIMEATTHSPVRRA